MISTRFSERYEGWLELIAPHHTVSGSSGIGRITLGEPAGRGSSAIPRPASTTTP